MQQSHYRQVFYELEIRQIRYLVAGGFAVNFHQIQRATVDLDLILELKENNIHKFVELMNDIGFEPNVPIDPTQFVREEVRKAWITEKGMMVLSFRRPSNVFEIIDVFVEEPRPFEQLWDNRFEIKAFGQTIRVLGRDDLISIKREAGRDKDLFDVKQLERLP